ncbi:hypothetical protein SLS62_006751 [Diatrype stigma]|uniref:Rhomboid-type serine protease n=1 Tax=Diatrype stigma TaxID=117547 RepID=A0AAN9US69_9PEZI
MAANDYYDEGRSRSTRQAPAPYYSAYDNVYEPSVVSAQPPPSYVTQAPPSHQQDPRAGAATTSPFETAFDDHVYPASSHTTPMDSQNSFAQDTRYHGANDGNVSPVAGDDIPLQSQNKTPQAHVVGAPLEPMDSNDHVYDTAERGGRRGGAAGGAAAGRGIGKLHFGELGMLGSGEKRRIPFMVYLFTLIQIGVFIGELVKAANLTGTPIQTSPTFNPMIGPSTYVLINMGARYPPCMHNVKGIQDQTTHISWPCPWVTTSDITSPDYQCTLSQVCGFAGVPEPEYKVPPGLAQDPAPNQWFRFIVPIFMHAGFIHIGFNLLLQLTLGKEIERNIGSIRFFLVYMFAGIFANVFGANYAGTAMPSTGASGALFGIIALTLLDLLYSWAERRHPWRELIFIIIQIAISFALGLLPGLDNFAHIGGFLVGICLGISVLHSPNALRLKIGEDHFGGPSYSNLAGGGAGISSVAFPAFYRNPVGFFKGRKPLWWAWWLIRAAFLILIIVVFIVLLNSFYSNSSSCTWCKHLSCLDVNDWCKNTDIQIQTTTAAARATTPTPTAS